MFQAVSFGDPLNNIATMYIIPELFPEIILEICKTAKKLRKDWNNFLRKSLLKDEWSGLKSEEIRMENVQESFFSTVLFGWRKGFAREGNTFLYSLHSKNNSVKNKLRRMKARRLFHHSDWRATIRQWFWTSIVTAIKITTFSVKITVCTGLSTRHLNGKN